LKCLLPVVALLVAVAGVAACGDSTEPSADAGSGHGSDNGLPVEDSGGVEDATPLVDAGTGEDVAPRDTGQDEVGDTCADTGAEDCAGYGDAGQPDAGQPDAGMPDAGSPDGGVIDGGQPAGFCRSWNACAGDKVCDFSLGRCETRDVKPAAQIAIYAFKPPAGAADDVLVVDGHKFYSSLMGMLKVTAKIGSVSKTIAGVDENRILIHVANGDTGVVAITGEGGQTATGNRFVPAPDGVIPCDGTTPMAPGAAGLSLSDMGPYAAGYVDDPAANIRVHYPAQCGSVRRPPVKGTFPLVALLHGDGAVYLNYEYLGQYLASWGFVTVMPEQAEESGNTVLQSMVAGYFNTDLAAITPVLSGVKTTDKIALVGHSRGTGRLEDITQAGVFSTATVAAVFLGPVDNGLTVPAGMFMVFYATNDGQSSEGNADGCYDRQAAPKWKVTINGGNHSLYSDHKVWLGALSDTLPTITRTQQFRTVTSFVLPLLERAFKMTEHFPGQIDTPPPSAEYVVKMEK